MFKNRKEAIHFINQMGYLIIEDNLEECYYRVIDNNGRENIIPFEKDKYTFSDFGNWNLK